MNLSILLLLTLSQTSWLSPDDLSTFRIRMEDDVTSFGKVDVKASIGIAHRLFLLADVEEDKSPRYFENTIRCGKTSVHVSYRWRAGLSYSFATGRLTGFAVHTPDKAKAPNLSPEDCVAKAIAWYKAAGGMREVVLDRAETQPGDQTVYVKLDFVSPGNPFRFDACIEAYVDRTFGFPDQMWIDEPPAYDPPARLADRETLVANAVAAAMALTGWKEVEVGVQEPRYHVPAYATLPNRMSDRHRRRAESSRAMLVYEVSVNDARVAWKEGQSRPFVQVYADAETGEPIAILPAFAMQGGPPTASRPLVWEGRWKVGTVEGGVEPTEVAAIGGKQGREVCLTQGNRRLLARYDARTGLLTYGEGSDARSGRPDKTLSRALSRARSPRSFPMNNPAVGAPKAGDHGATGRGGETRNPRSGDG